MSMITRYSIVKWIISWFGCWHDWGWEGFMGPMHFERHGSSYCLAWVQHYSKKTCKKCGKVEWDPKEPDEEIKPRKY
jgi:hypothetical protein